MTPALQEKFHFVIEAINKSDQPVDLDPNDLPEDSEMTIREAEDYYDITIDNQYYSY